MSFEVMEWIFICAGLVLSAFFSGAEAALMSISVDRTKQLIEEGGAKGEALQFLLDKPNHILTTILVGNNLVNTMVAAFVTSITSRYFADDAVAISVGIVTVFILLFGEIAPKTFARSHAEKLALPTIYILKLFYYACLPVIHTFMWIIEKVLGKNAQLQGRMVTRDDIEFLVSKAEEDKTIDSKHLDLLSSILEFPTIKVKDIMVTRQNIVVVTKNITYEEILQIIKKREI